MALGLIKKFFSFGKKEVEERPPEGEAAPDAAAEATAEPAAGHPPHAPESQAPADDRGEPAAPQTDETPAAPEPPEAPDAPAAPHARPDAPAGAAPQVGPAQPIDTVEPEPTPAPAAPEEPAPAAAETPDRAAEPETERAAPPEPEPEPEPVAAPEPEPEPEPAPPPPRTEAKPAADEPRRPDAEPASPEAPRAGTTPAEPPAAAAPSVEPGPSVEPAPPAAPPAPEAEAPAAPGRVTVARTVERPADAAPQPAAPDARPSWVQRLRDGLSRSSRELKDSISGVFTKRRLDEDTLQDLEDVLLRADLGLETAMRVTDALAAGRYGRDVSEDEVRTVMADEVEKVLAPVALPLELDLSHKPHVILVVGVNGTGKTTTIGKLAAKLTEGGLSVMLAAGDTFRAAAIEQLKIWGERTGSPVVASKLGADAAGLAWDAFEKARAAGSDVLIIDTAGRLQNKAELMAELEKIVRVLGRHDPEAPHTVLQTVDATTGQNALSQVEIFRNVAGVNGLVMTKLDGTARGGILVAIAAKHKLPVYFIGVGEQVDDLEPFSAGDFARAIAGVNP
ncbi:signal recognition particle-docking protein FtsY [Aquibium sp. A9E412]|uniref:signal recognition particle-docking protein FtsY n=1 Tax=Aquibium sp. A9E412 TaxID=2976767 RepID=UPI0025B0F020|nr:signal recognition particle-docking protein FtsY [Aquibium sp. A9E412]MDN2565680.1 signal recognition particle-docking protein FtsY [Aquibium sp. A9E412]